jgi:general stress protein 26
MARIDWNAKVREALTRTDIMALSTVGSDGSWTSPVQYTHDEKLNLFFLSKPDAKHVANILQDPQVSLAIYHPERLPASGDGSLGLQIKGTARKIAEEGEWHRFKITPDEVWCFDSRVSLKRQRIQLGGLKR